MQQYKPHPEAKRIAMDGSPVHPFWDMHCSLWQPTVEVRPKLFGTGVNNGCLVSHLIAAFWDYDNNAVSDFRPGRLRN